MENIFQFLFDFYGILVDAAANLWDFLQSESIITGVPVWALLGSGTLIFTIFIAIIRAIVG